MVAIFIMGISPFFVGTLMERQLMDNLDRELAGLRSELSAGPTPSVDRFQRIHESAFRDGTRVVVSDGGQTSVYEIDVRTLGKLKLNSGRLVAVDPFFAWIKSPFTVTLPKGEHPVQVSLAYNATTRTTLVAQAMLRVSKERAVRWEPTRYDTILEQGVLGGYPVDSGNGSFMDEEALSLLTQNYDFAERLLEELDTNGYDSFGWANVVANRQTGANVITFDAGYGDGVYLSYVGYSASGEPVAVVTDFAVLDGLR
jgi:hypothetical protein